jgi:alpha-mannosidase
MPTKPMPVPSDGYLRDWLVLGPFSGDTARNMWTPFIREETTRPSSAPTKAQRWRRMTSRDAVIDFMRDAPFFGQHAECCAYAHVYVEVPEAQEVALLLGSDDGIAVWVNGTRVFLYEAMRGCVPDENVVSVELAAGWNSLLVKVTQYGGAWAFACRLLSTRRVPVLAARYALDDPTKGRWNGARQKGLPLALGVGHPSPAAMADAEPGSVLRLPIDVLNVSSRATEAGVVEVHDAAGVLGALPVASLGPMQWHKTQITLPIERWAAAFAVPLSFTAKAGKRRLSASAHLAPDPLSAFLLSTRSGPPALLDGASERFRRVRDDLATSSDILAERPALGAAIERLTDAIDRADAPNILAHLAAIDDDIARASTEARKGSVHLAGHAHIDMNWLWRWPETVQACRDTFRQALRFIDEFPAFRISQSQASVYEAMELEDPDLFDGIRAAVRSGRWEVTGGMWTEGDTNLSSGEALCRSFLLAQRYFRNALGVEAKVGWLPDNFGHCAQLPQLLRLASIDCFYHMRCSPPGAQIYWWQGIDGSRVLAKTGQGYNDQVTPAIRRQPALLPKETPHQLFVYGVGNHGGGPTRRDIETASRLQTNRLFPKIEFSTAGEYFAHVRPLAGDAMVHEGELQFVFEGCYTSVSRIKQGNRNLENALQATEALAVVAVLAGHPYPAADLNAAWKVLVFNQFHDILPGSAIHESNADSVANYQRALEACRTLRLRLLRWLGERIDAPVNDASIPLLVFNPLAFERSDVVVAEVVLTSPVGGFRVRDRSGRDIPAQIVRTRQYDAAVHYWVQFVATAVGGLGCEVFELVPLFSEEPVPITHWSQPYPVFVALPRAATGNLTRTKRKIRNRFFELSIDERDGSIRSLALRRGNKLGRTIVGKGGLNRLGIFLEKPNAMSAWTLDPKPEGPLDVAVVGGMEVVQEGTESITWICRFAYGASSFTLTTTVHADSPRIDALLTAEWVERGTDQEKTPVLRLLHHLAEAPGKLLCDVPFAALEREAGREVPAQKWASVGLAGGHLALLNRGKYGHSLVGKTLGLTLLRSSFFPDVLPDVGRHEISWSLVPHEGASNAELARVGLGFNVPFETLQLRPQSGSVQPQATLVCKSPSFVVTGTKKAEDSDAIILRGYDASGCGGEVQIACSRSIAHAEKLDILEQPTNDPAPKVRGASVVVATRPWEIVTVALQLQ